MLIVDVIVPNFLPFSDICFSLIALGKCSVIGSYILSQHSKHAGECNGWLVRVQGGEGGPCQHYISLITHLMLLTSYFYMLLTCYQHVTNVLLLCYKHVTLMLLRCYSHVTSILLTTSP